MPDLDEFVQAGRVEPITADSVSYRLLRAVLNTAVEPDNILTRNPCKIPGADKETPAERPVMSVAQVFALADRVGTRSTAAIRAIGC